MQIFGESPMTHRTDPCIVCSANPSEISNRVAELSDGLATELPGLPHHQHQLSTKMASLAHAVCRSCFREPEARHFGDAYGPCLEQSNQALKMRPIAGNVGPQ